MGAIIKQFDPYLLKREANQNEPPALDIIDLHKETHERWRWYGVKPEVRRLYELWGEIEQEDKTKSKGPRRWR